MFERFETPRPVGSGLILQPVGQAVLHQLGLFEQIAALGQPIDRLIGNDAESGRTVLDVRYLRLRGIGRGLGVHRATLFDVLHQAVLAGHIPIHTGFMVSSMERRAGKSWLLAGAAAEGPFDLVIDTLGTNSPLKRFARYPVAPKALAFGAIWATTPWVDEGFERRALMQCYRHASVMIGVLPIGRQSLGGRELAAFFWSLRTAEHDALLAAGIEAWKERVRELWPETEPHLASISGFEQLNLARYSHHTLRVPVGEGIVFVGDSAHATSPQLGQGANMALLDAYALALALQGNGGVNAALLRYAALRRWHVRLYQVLSLALTPFYQSGSRVLPFIRDVAVAYLAQVPPAPQILAAMVAGRLLDPMRTLGLAAAPELESEREASLIGMA